MVIFARNETEIVWTAQSNSTCENSKLELQDSGVLSLKCSDGSVIWSPADQIQFDSESQPEDEPASPCFTIYADQVDSVDKRSSIAQKCLKERSGKVIFGYGGRAISINDWKCGVRNVSIEIANSEICFTDEQKLGKNANFSSWMN